MTEEDGGRTEILVSNVGCNGSGSASPQKSVKNAFPSRARRGVIASKSGCTFWIYWKYFRFRMQEPCREGLD